MDTWRVIVACLLLGACVPTDTGIIEPHEQEPPADSIYRYPPPVIGGCRDGVCRDTLMPLP